MLNATLCATGRAICCLLETYQVLSSSSLSSCPCVRAASSQEADGVRIPEVLVPYMGGITFLPFVREGRADNAG
jgi:seryl-tRNA synthetase